MPDIASSINDRIAHETRAVHARNNRLANLKLVLALKSPIAFRAYLVPFFFVYKTFEAELARIKQAKESDESVWQVLEQIEEPILLRTAKLEQDLRFYFDDADIETLLAEPATAAQEAYVAHIRQIAKDDPVKLLAYSSVMYLALFAGGQIIKGKLVKRYGFFPTKPGLSQEETIAQGTHLFTFDTDNVQQLKKRHRDIFDQAVAEYLTPAQQDRLVDEAKEIFVRNEQLIAEVEVPGAAWITLSLLKWPLLIISSLIAFYLLPIWAALVLLLVALLYRSRSHDAWRRQRSQDKST